MRNTDPGCYEPEQAGYLGFGDHVRQQAESPIGPGSRTRRRTGARFLTFTRATRVLTQEGRATGVAAVWQPPDGRASTGHGQGAARRRRLRLARVAGAPAALGIGGPAVGHNFRLHPSCVVGAAYGTDQQAWWGPPQARLCDEFADTGEGYGFLIETAQYAPGLIGSATPWVSGQDHKQRMEEFRFTGTFISLTRDRGAGQVIADAERRGCPDVLGRPIPLDLENLKQRDRGRRSACTRRPAPTRSGRSRRGLPPGGGATTSRPSSPCQADPVPRRRLQALQRPPDGYLPHGRRSRDARSPGPTASCTTPRESGSGTAAPSRPHRGPTRWSASCRSPTGRRRRSPMTPAPRPSLRKPKRHPLRKLR